MTLLRPIGAKVAIKMDNVNAERRHGNILLPAGVHPDGRSTLFGTVYSIGPDVAEGIEEGDRVIVMDYGGHPIKLDGVEYRIYLAEDVLCVIDSEPGGSE